MPSNSNTIWTEGMFLRPQHFQQQDRHLQNWVESRCAGLQAYSWGISQLSIDTQLLMMGKFSVTSCQGVFPDGTPFSMPDDCPPPPPFEIPADCKEEVVYLALPIRKTAGRDVADAHEDNLLSRYRLKEIEAKDFHSTVNSSATLQVGDLWTRIRLANQDQGAFGTIPIAKIIERRADGEVILDSHYISSCLNCSASSHLNDFIMEILGLLHHRSKALAKRLGTPGAGGVSEVVDFLLLQIVNRYEPLFRHYSGLRPLHPEALYQTLVQMAGELATITHDDHCPTDYPNYVHTDLSSTFTPLVETIRDELNWVPDLRAISIPLETHQFGVHTATVHDTQLIRNANFILAVNAQIPGDKLRSDFPRQTTIATTEKLRDLVMTHTSGVDMHALSVAPRQIPFHAGFTYFELDKHNDLWKELETTGAIAMHLAGKYPGLEMELWAIKR